MIRLSADTSQLQRLDGRFTRTGRTVSDRQVNNAALKQISKPILEAVKQEAPASSQGQSIPLSARRYAASARNNYRRGGSTKADARIKIVAGQGVEVSRALVGIDKRSGKVGWRTHFITRGTKPRYTKKPRRFVGVMPKNDFLARAEARTVPKAVQDYGQIMTQQVERGINRTT